MLDLPGGMRIGTIHAFCQSLLRRFPLEAALSPHFQLVDEYDADAALTDARETMLARADAPALRDALTALAGLASATQFGRQVEALQERPRPTGSGAGAAGPGRRPASRPAHHRRDRRGDHRRRGELAGGTRRCAPPPSWCTSAAPRPAPNAPGGCWPGSAWKPDERIEHWAHWCTEFLTGEGKARADGGFVNKALLTQQPELAPVFQAECSRILAALDDCRALRLAALSGALLTLAAPVLRAYAAHKENSRPAGL